MTLADIFEELAYGELSQLAIGNLIADDAESTIAPKDYAKVMSHINMGLKKLYGIFFLATKEVIIQQYDHIQTYTLDARYAVTNTDSDEPIKYIMDSIFEPFVDEVFKIESVYNEGGELMFMNDSTEPWSIFTPAYNAIQVPFPIWCNTLGVHYRAEHPKVIYTAGMDPKDITVDIPNGLLQALLYYVAHRAHAGTNVDQGQQGLSYYQKFQASVKDAKMSGLEITPNLTNTKLDRTGWV